jgi:hypothetical protein
LQAPLDGVELGEAALEPRVGSHRASLGADRDDVKDVRAFGGA